MSASETLTSTQPVSPRGWPTPKHMSPGHFALVMGTGIVTIGADQRGWHTAADILLIVTGLEYAVLVLLALWRLGAYRHDVVVDLTNPRTSFQFFTFPAATNVLAAARDPQAPGGHRTAGRRNRGGDRARLRRPVADPPVP